MINSATDIRAYFNTVVLEQYKNAQRERWMTENASEGSRWKDLNTDYAASKLTRFAGFPGGGRKMLIATGKLFENVFSPRKVVKPRTMELFVSTSDVPYARYVDEERPFMRFGRTTRSEILDGIRNYLLSRK